MINFILHYQILCKKNAVGLTGNVNSHPPIVDDALCFANLELVNLSKKNSVSDYGVMDDISCALELVWVVLLLLVGHMMRRGFCFVSVLF